MATVFTTTVASSDHGSKATLPPDLAPCAERFFRRFPELFCALGHPSLPTEFHMPPSSASNVEVQDASHGRVVRIALGRRNFESIRIPERNLHTVGNTYESSGVGMPTRSLGASGTATCPDIHRRLVRGDPIPQGILAAHSPQPQSALPPPVEPLRSAFATSDRTKGSKELSFATAPIRPSETRVILPISRRTSESSPDRQVRQHHSASASMSSNDSLSSPERKVVRRPVELTSLTPLSSLQSLSPSDSPSSSPVASSASPQHSRRTPSLKARRGLSDLSLYASPDKDDCIAEEPPASVDTEKPREERSKRRIVVGRSGGHGCSSPEHRQPAVQLMRKERRRARRGEEPPTPEVVARPPRPLPAAFPNRRTIFFFDWDDTLCPTSWIRSMLKDHLADLEQWAPDRESPIEFDWRDAIPDWFRQPLPDEPLFRESIKELQHTIIKLIEMVQAFGVLCIVTNAYPGWVERTIARWLPKLTPYIFGHGARPQIRVLHGQQHYSTPDSLQQLPWVDQLGELMWWKQSAMTRALDEVEDLYRLDSDSQKESWCRSWQSKLVSTIVSVGDNEAEMQAAEISGCLYNERRRRLHLGGEGSSSPSHKSLTRTRTQTVSHIAPAKRVGALSVPVRDRSLSHKPWVKLVKFKFVPHVSEVNRQLEELMTVLPQLVSLHKHLRLELDDSVNTDQASMLHGQPVYDLSSLASAADMRVEYALRTQTV